ncbi:hypothetical protein G6321_00009525 [Bradyrhizobium barranii subsp. barranii]|uniref:Uncharacterized protein n=1 Tax=Bradyrhizobium barranii subsp. barranii TaxID=2823807 RepID=A0A7Z0TJX5_9BRAD|nr:hypothetical protein [Bradyrhizobium barranii]UGX95358.1 hypothetical protein G6321_00009525 [Bradyrhizobium barranii subsp. barranii]
MAAAKTDWRRFACSAVPEKLLPRGLPVAQIPKSGAKALKSIALHLSDHRMVRTQYDFALVVVQKAELRLAWN